jgi:hypothetical protein
LMSPSRFHHDHGRGTSERARGHTDLHAGRRLCDRINKDRMKAAGAEAAPSADATAAFHLHRRPVQAPLARLPLFGGQGTINANSWSPGSTRFAFDSDTAAPTLPRTSSGRNRFGMRCPGKPPTACGWCGRR